MPSGVERLLIDSAIWSALVTAGVFVVAMILRVLIFTLYPNGALLFAEDFLFLLETYRSCWFSGRVRGGKTSLCYFIAYLYLKNKLFRYLMSNVPDCWRIKGRDVVLRDNQFLDAVVILDEGGQYLKDSDSADVFVFAQGKMNNMILIPSVVAPSRSMCTLICEFAFDFSTYGVPLSIYNWKLKTQNNTEKGWFLWVNQRAVYGVFNTGIPVLSDDGISGFIKATVQYLIKINGGDKNYYGNFTGFAKPKSKSVLDMGALEMVAANLEGVADELSRTRRRR